MRGAYLEVLGDLLGSIAVVIAAVVILFTGFTAADAIASAVIAVMILPRACGCPRRSRHRRARAGSSAKARRPGLLEVIADTAGELEDHIAAMNASLEELRPWLPAASDSASEPADGVRP